MPLCVRECLSGDLFLMAKMCMLETIRIEAYGLSSRLPQIKPSSDREVVILSSDHFAKHKSFSLIGVSLNYDHNRSRSTFSLSLFLFFPLSGVRCCLQLFTASSAIIIHPPLSPVFFFQSPSSPVFFTSLLTQSSHLSLGLPRLLLPCSRNYAALFGIYIVRHPPSFLRVQPTVICSSPVSLSSSSALPSLPFIPTFFACLLSLSPSHTRLTTRLRPTCDRKMGQS